MSTMGRLGIAQNAVSAGILVVGGPLTADCEPSACPLTVGTQIAGNVVLENDVGIFVENVASALGAPAATPTRITIAGNSISKASLTNGTGNQVGIFVVGNRDRIISNSISGPGYDPSVNPGAFVRRIFAEAPFAIDPVVRRNRIFP